jgi:hypothetical protein
MLTWLDYVCKQSLPSVDLKWHGGDPRKALAFYVGECITAAKRRVVPFEDILDETFHVMLIPFIREFLACRRNVGDHQRPRDRPPSWGDAIERMLDSL